MSFGLLKLSELKAEGNYSSDSMNYYIENGNYEYALKHLRNAKPSDSIGNDSTLIDWMISYGWVNSLLVRADSSYEILTQAIQLANKNKLYNLELRAKGTLLEVYRRMEMYLPAFRLIKNIDTASNLFSDQTKSYVYHRAAAIYNESCYTFEDSSLLDTAIIYSKKSLFHSAKTNNYDHKATSYNELGNIYERKGNLKLAALYYRKSMDLWPNKTSMDYANSVKNYGSYHARRGNLDSTIYYFNRVAKILSKTSEHRLLADVYQGMQKAYKQKGDSLNFYKYSFYEMTEASFMDRMRLENKLFEMNQRQEAAERDAFIRESKIEVEAAQDQKNLVVFILVLVAIILVVVTLTYLLSRRKNRQLAKLVKENEFLVGESNHRIKNNLQLIISLIGREIYKSKESENSLREISDKITSIATLHQHLYQSDAKEQIQIKDYLNSIIENFKNLNYFHQIEIEVAIDSIELQIDRSVYLGLLVTELFTNSVKHAFEPNQKQKKISLAIVKHNHSFTLNYGDNGTGINDKKTKPQLVNLLSRQLKAQKLKEEEEVLGYQLHLKIKL